MFCALVMHIVDREALLIQEAVSANQTARPARGPVLLAPVHLMITLRQLYLQSYHIDC